MLREQGEVLQDQVVTFDPDNPTGHTHKPKPKAAPKARNEFWRVTGPIYTGPVRKCKVYKESKNLTWIINDD